MAQQNWTWAEHAGTGSDQRSYDVATDGNGNAFISGYIKGSGNNFDGNLVSAVGGEDAFLAKYDANGNNTWVKACGGSGDDQGYSIAVDNAGGVYICGYFSGTATFFGSPNITLTSSGGKDLFVAKYNASGSVLWARKAGSGGTDDIAYGICTNGTSVFVTGSFSNTVNFGALPSISSAGGTDVFIAAYNASTGVESWVVRGGGTGNDEGHDIAVDAGGVYASGFYGPGTANFQNQAGSLASNGGSDVYLVKYDLSGSGVWTRRAGSSGPEECYGVAVHGSFVYISGFFNGTMNLYNSGPSVATITNANGEDAFLIQYDATTGNYGWVRSENGNGPDRAYSVAVNTYGYVFMTGRFNGNLPMGSGPSVSSNNEDLFVTAYNSSGTFQWGRTASGSDQETGTGIATDDGDIYVAGYFKNGPVSFGSISVNSYSNEDILLAKLNCSSTTTAAAGPDQTLCAGTATLAGNTAVNGTGAWSLVSGTGTITTPSSPNSTVNSLGVGANSFQWTITNSTCPITSDTVIITRDQNPTTSNAGSNQTLCSATSSLAGNTPVIGSGTWTLISGTGTITTPSSPSSPVTGLGVGTNTFQWTITNGTCPASTDQVTITRDANPTTANAGTDQTLCTSSSTFAGNTPAIGSGTWTLVSGTGSITSPSLPTSAVTGLSVGANVFQWTISNGTCPSSSDQVTITRDPNPTTANAGPDQTLCSSSATFAGNTPAIGSGTWTLISGTGTITSPTSPTSAVTGLSVGANVFQWTITNGTCPASSDQVTITRDPNPTTANAGLDQTLCTSSVNFTGNAPIIGSGTWSLISGTGTITSPTSPTSTVTGLSVGANVFQWTITNGTCPASSDQVTITRDPNPTTANAGLDQTLCTSSSTFAGNTPTIGSGTWTLVSGTGSITSPSSPTSAVTGLSVGANVFQWTITNGTCPASSDQVTITRDPNPTTANAGLDQTLCTSSANFTGNAPTIGSGTWSLISGTGTITSPTSSTSAVTGLSVGANIFQWTISNGTCPSSSDQVTITRDPNPTVANAGPDQTLCSSSATFAGNTPAIGSGTWTLISGTGTIISPTSPTSAVTGLSVGANVFQWTITNGTCPASSDQVTITRDPNPTTANAGTDQTLCTSSTTFAGNTATIGSGLWTRISGTGTIVSPSSPNSAVNGLTAGTNVFQWKISNGTCPASFDTVIIVRDQNPTAANAGSNQTLCSATSSLAGNTPAIGSGTWTLISGTGAITTPSSPSSAVTGLSVGVNTFQWSITNGTCPASLDTVVITIDANPTTANAGVDQTICSSSSVFAANMPTIGNGSWSRLTGTGNIVTAASPVSAVNNLIVGTNIFEWTISNGTCPASSDTVMITVDANPTPASTGPDQTLCTAVSTLTGNVPITGSGSWNLISGSGSISTANLPVSLVTGLTTGTNVFQWTISNGVCPSSSDTTIITIDAQPTSANAGTDQTLCTAASSLAGNTAIVGNGLWTVLSGSGIVLSPALPNSAVSGLSTGANVFRWTIINGTCPLSDDTVTFYRDANPTVANAGADQTQCTSTYNLSGNAPVIGNGNWSLVSGTGSIGSPSSPGTSATGLSVGNNIFQWTITNGTCPASADTVIITVDAIPTLANAGSDQTICSSASGFSGNAPVIGNGTWSLVSGTGSIGAASSPSSSVNGLSVGNNIFQWTISNGTCPSSSDTVMITVDANPTIANAGTDQTLCSAPSTTLNGNTPLTGNGAWNLVSGTGTVASPTTDSTAVNGLGTGANSFVWTITNGVCPASTDTVIIMIDANPTAALAGTDAQLCSSFDTLNANIPLVGTGLWQAIGGSATFSNATLPNAVVNNLSAGTNLLAWIISNGVCPASHDTVLLTYTPAPTPAFAGNDLYVCGDSVVLQAQTPAIGTGFWTNISNTGSIADTADPHSFLSNLPDGIHYYTWTTTNAYCISTPDTVAVYTYSPPSVADAGTDQLVHTAFANLQASAPTTGSGSWSVISGAGQFEHSDDPNTRVFNLGSGMNVLRWTTSNGVCTSSTDDVRIESDPLIIPTGYSPNGDGVNDQFEITGLLEYTNAKLEVFNRWGNKVFTSANYRNDWNGVSDNQQLLPDDVYYYVLALEDGTTFNGYVAIKRTKP